MHRTTLVSSRIGAGALVVGAFLALSSTARAQAVNVDAAGVALSGYDPVAYLADSAAVMGSAALIASHDGATYRFASVAHRDTFQADPARYVPMYGGYCAYGVANGHKVKIDPEAFRVLDGRLYLNYSKGVQAKWIKDIPGNIAAAERNWPALRDKPRDD
jgi:YHS domain-containing protein